MRIFFLRQKIFSYPATLSELRREEANGLGPVASVFRPLPPLLDGKLLVSLLTRAAFSQPLFRGLNFWIWQTAVWRYLATKPPKSDPQTAAKAVRLHHHPVFGGDRLIPYYYFLY